MEYQQKQEGSFFINEASVITAYFQKQLNIIERILEKRHRKMSKEDIHRLRIAVKKIKALSTLVLFCRPDFRINKFMKPFNRIFKVAGKMRELQLEISRLKKMQSGSLKDYLHHLKTRLKKKKHLFFSLSDKQLRRKLKKRSETILPLFHDVSKTFVNRFLQEKRNAISKLLIGENLKEKQAHELRKRLKELYYTIFIFGIKDKRFANIDGFQELLGQWHNDVVLKNGLKKVLDKKDEPENELKIISNARNQISFESKVLFEKIKVGAAGIDKFFIQI
jgi:CHAD domain-containing protein